MTGNSWDCFGDDALYDEASLDEARAEPRTWWKPGYDPRPALEDAYEALGRALANASSGVADERPRWPEAFWAEITEATLAIGAAKVLADSAAAEFECSDLIGPERSEGPTVAPRTLLHTSSKCVHRGNTPAQSDISTIREAPAATDLGSGDPQVRGLGCGTLGLASDGKPVALDPIGSRARLRDALHGDDGNPGNGRVGVNVEVRP